MEDPSTLRAKLVVLYHKEQRSRKKKRKKEKRRRFGVECHVKDW